MSTNLLDLPVELLFNITERLSFLDLQSLLLTSKQAKKIAKLTMDACWSLIWPSPDALHPKVYDVFTDLRGIASEVLAQHNELLLASRNGQIDVVRNLLGNGACPNPPMAEILTSKYALVTAIEATVLYSRINQRVIVEALLTGGANLNLGWDGAARVFGSLNLFKETAKLLVDSGLKMDEFDGEKNSLLHYVVLLDQNQQTIQVLSDYFGALITLENLNGETVLDIATNHDSACCGIIYKAWGRQFKLEKLNDVFVGAAAVGHMQLLKRCWKLRKTNTLIAGYDMNLALIKASDALKTDAIKFLLRLPGTNYGPGALIKATRALRS
ncbi:hypothetical protein BJX99DRAFT_260563 [Aspergillus californicus]